MKSNKIINSWDKLNPDEETKQHMLNKITSHKKQKVISPKRLMASAAIFTLLTTCVLAATNSSFQDMLSRMNPFFRDYVQPVELNSIDQGIKLEVVAVGMYDNELKAYITLQDLEGNRINETTEFYTGVQVDNEPVAVGGSEERHFDSQSGVLTRLIQVKGTSSLENQKASFGIGSLRSNPRHYGGEGYTRSFRLEEVNANPETITLTHDNKSITSTTGVDTSGNDFEITVLKPGGAVQPFPGIDFMNISNIGIIDGKLHVQIWSEKSTDKVGNINILDNNGNLVFESTRRSEISFQVNDRGEPVESDPFAERSYQCNEIIFDIDPNISQYQLVGNFTVWDEIKVDLRVAFDINASENDDIIELDASMVTEGVKFDKLIITPFGIRFIGFDIIDFELVNKRIAERWNANPSPTFNYMGLDIELQSDEVAPPALGYFNSFSDGDQTVWNVNSTKPINTKSLTAISINGNVIQIKK